MPRSKKHASPFEGSTNLRGRDICLKELVTMASYSPVYAMGSSWRLAGVWIHVQQVPHQGFGTSARGQRELDIGDRNRERSVARGSADQAAEAITNQTPPLGLRRAATRRLSARAAAAQGEAGGNMVRWCHRGPRPNVKPVGARRITYAHAESCYKRARVARRAVPRAPTRGGWDPGVRTAGRRAG